MRPVRAAALALLVALTGCGAGDAIFGGEDAIESAHAVFLARADCPYFVTNRTRNSFAVFGALDGFSARQGDLLVGNLRTGTLRLGVIPSGVEDVERTLVFNVVGHGLSLAEAQALYYGACPLPPREIAPGSPGLPLAPDAPGEDVPPGEVRPDTTPDVPPDSTGAF